MTARQSNAKRFTTLQHLCMLALIKAGKKYTTLRKILGIPVAHIAQKLFEFKVSKSLVLIKLKRTFADGSYMQAIACGYHLAKREFVFGHFAGMASDNIRSRINWSESMKIKEAIKAISMTFAEPKPLRRRYFILDTEERLQSETRLLYYHVAVWLSRYWNQLGLTKNDIRQIVKFKKHYRAFRSLKKQDARQPLLEFLPGSLGEGIG